MKPIAKSKHNLDFGFQLIAYLLSPLAISDKELEALIQRAVQKF
jgi:hypothetical protein